MLKIVLDTSIFVNPQSHHLFGKTPQEALSNFLDILKEKKDISCYFPPSVYEELMKFMENKLPTEKTVLLHKKPPSSYQSSIPSLFLYEFIEEMRSRVNRGLRVAEKYTRRGLSISPSREENLPLNPSSNGIKRKEEEIIKNLRTEFRIGVREGIIDSKEDFDLILLAKEIDAHLATSDNGLIKWAHKLGITCMSAQELKETIHASCLNKDKS
ncbi:MAG: RNA ligase partner protein [Candidatus Omnitrophica bacterium]|nr:RNA ligase partner protein [Candidatus Omnitrophota bacterium]MBU1366921.1 RNA ligase partner protein [Candidatus Omnitrophota bacterium]MBU1523758.1 RNA ligase partner protein [Candidatus Omnitrophota bacterium]MBU1810195.1 RNA ligase partner protein [Candidatus Omnitrophota bacterium]MBU2436561.1 RNA ligase partner protein [Candidatus Omnitrophota bacterium]